MLLCSFVAKSYLKKQTQCRNAQMNVTPIITKDYVKHAALGGRKNKANQSRFQGAGSDVEWIPASAGMTNGESLCGGAILTIWKNKANVREAKNDVNFFLGETYGNNPCRKLQKNKPKRPL